MPDTRPAPNPSWGWHRLVYGDWTWFVRDPLDLLRLAFFAGTIAFAVMGRLSAVGLTAASVLLLVARIVNLPRRFDLGLIVAMTLIAWGTALGLYGDYYVYDNIVHSLSPICYAPVLYIALVRLDVLTDPERTTTTYHHVGVFVSTLAIGMAVGAGYEVVEWLSDTLLGTHLVASIDDTGSDLLEDTLGSLAGAALVTVWSVRHWSSRRIPVGPVAEAKPGVSFARGAVRRIRPHLGRGLRGWRHRMIALPVALKGAIGIGTGTLLLVWPSPALRTVGVVFALAMLAHAVVDLAEGVSGRAGGRGDRLAVAAAELAIGTLVLAWPEISRLALLYAIGAFAVTIAVVEAASLSTGAWSDRERWLGGARSAFAFVFGVALLAAPRRSLDAIIVALSLYLLILGALQLVRALGTFAALGGGARDDAKDAR